MPCLSSLWLLVLIVHILTRRLPLPLQAHVCKQDYFWQKNYACTHTYTRTHVRRICAKKKILLRCYATHFFYYSSPISNFFLTQPRSRPQRLPHWRERPHGRFLGFSTPHEHEVAEWPRVMASSAWPFCLLMGTEKEHVVTRQRVPNSRVNPDIYIYIYIYIYMCVCVYIYVYLYISKYIHLYNDDACFYYHSWRNNVVIAFGTLSSFLT